MGQGAVELGAVVGVALRLWLAALAWLLAILARGPSFRFLGLAPLVVFPLTADPRWVFAAAALSLLVPSVLALDDAPPPRRAAWTLALGLVALGSLAFGWLLPKLPAVTRLYAPVVGAHRYASPRQLWLALVVAAPLLALLARVPGALGGARRARLGRRVEVALLLNLAALVLGWLGAALGTLPRFVDLAPRAAVLAGAVGGLGWLFVIPALRRPRPCTDAGPGEE